MPKSVEYFIFKTNRFIGIVIFCSFFVFNLSAQNEYLINELLSTGPLSNKEIIKNGIKSISISVANQNKIKWYFDKTGNILTEEKENFIYQYKFGKRITARNTSLEDVSISGLYKKYKYTPGLITISYINDQNQTFKKDQFNYADLDNNKLESERSYFKDSLSTEYRYQYDTYSRLALKEKYLKNVRNIYWKYSYPKSNTKLEEKFIYDSSTDTYILNSSLLNSATYSTDSSVATKEKIDYNVHGDLSSQLNHVIVKNNKGVVVRIEENNNSEITEGLSTLNKYGRIDFICWTSDNLQYKQLYHYDDNQLLTGITFENKNGQVIFEKNLVNIEYKYY